MKLLNFEHEPESSVHATLHVLLKTTTEQQVTIYALLT